MIKGEAKAERGQVLNKIKDAHNDACGFDWIENLPLGKGKQKLKEWIEIQTKANKLLAEMNKELKEMLNDTNQRLDNEIEARKKLEEEVETLRSSLDRHYKDHIIKGME